MKPHSAIVFGCAVASLLLASCTSLWQGSSGTTRKGVSSSLVSYLYPAGEEPPGYDDRVPLLRLPLRIGIAFVPTTGNLDVPGFSEATKVGLLEKVKGQFLDRDYISDIQAIPDSYMRGTQGFSGLEQVARLYQLDLIALVSYDQVVASDDTTASILYWTIIGAYVIEGSRSDVQTFVDTAVFDMTTRKLLIRAPGLDKASRKSTLVDSNKDLRDERSASFDRAMTDMTANLKSELERFELRLKEDPTVAQVDRSRMSGGGAAGPVALLALLLLGSMFRQLKRHRRPASLAE